MNRKSLTLTAALATAGAVTAVLAVLPSASAAPNTTASDEPAAASTKLGTASYLPLSVAKKVSDIAMQKGLEKGYPVSVTVVDRDGVVINQQRADTATGATVQVSFEKAYAAASRLRPPTFRTSPRPRPASPTSPASAFCPAVSPSRSTARSSAASVSPALPPANSTPTSPTQRSRPSTDHQ
nr:heme-binding protein [Streptomyces sp. S1D4-11]QIZ01002.1 hypothetical protein HEP87_54240 [Streptomyces sp. S1D4-11]